jgi:hypothetical protein
MENIQILKKNVETLLNNGVELIPINNIKIGNNSKNDFGSNMPDGWNNPRLIRFNKDKTLEALNNGCIGFFGRAGKRTGNIIIDVDNKQTTNPEILTELINKCKFYIKSPNGYHFYFKNTDYFKKKHLGVFGNIDILTNENIYFFGIREDGIYTIIKDEKITQIPENIRNQLLEGIKQKEINKSVHIDINDTTETPYKDNETYFITSNELIQLLEDLDKDYNNDTNEWIKISSILKKAGFKEAWKVWSSKSNKYNDKNNEVIFKRLRVGDNVPDLNYIIEILNNQSKKKYNIISKIYKPYQPLTDANKSLITKTINEKYLNADIYDTFKDNIIKSSLGTAKTHSTFDYILKNDYNILSICQLINNVDNHIRDFKNHPSNINNRCLLAYNETPDYELENHIQGYRNDETDFINNVNGICTTIDSLAKVHKKYFSNNNIIRDYVIFMDEIHSDLLHLLTSSTLKGKRTETIDILYDILKNCKKIIMSDGNICDVVLTFYKSLDRCSGYEFILNEYKSFNGVNVYHKSLKGIYSILNNNVKNNTFATIACNTKSKVEDIYKYLNELKKTYDKEFKILCYTSTEGEKIEDVNKEWQNAFIIYSPSIISGLDFRSKTPQDVILFIDGKETINAEQMGQQICRNRNINTVYICCSHYSNTLKYNTIEDLRNDYNKRLNDFHSCSFYKQLADKILINQKYEYKPNDFTNLYSLSVFHNNIMSSNILYYIEEILKSYGFNFHNRYSTDKNKGCEKIENQQIEEYQEPQDIIYDDLEKYQYFIDDIKNDIEIEETKYNKQLMNRFKYINLEIPKTPEEKETFLNILNDYDDILRDPHSFNNHMSLIHFIKSIETLKTDFIETNNKDFKEHNMNSKITRLLNIKTIINKYLPEIDIYDLSYNEMDEKYNDVINMTTAEYEYIKSFVRTKKDAPKNKRELLSVIVKCYKDILGDMIFKPVERKKKHINNKYINYNIITFNKEYFKSHLELFKYSLIYSKSTKDYKKKYDKTICDILDTLEHIKKPSNSRK